MEFWNLAILVGAALLLVSIVASDISSRMGAPLLLVFLLLGMLAGEDGPGGIRFDDFETAYVIGTLALAVIIFDGGMRTSRETFRVALWPAISLATVGVLVTAALVGVFAAWVLKLSWLEGLLLGAIVGSTDAAAVFALLRTQGALVDVILPTLLLAAALMIVARPLAVAFSLAPFRFPWREQLYIGWVGLRGAVPIVLALFPMMYGLENARLYFNVAFFVVLVSLLLQGWTIAPAARWLRLEAPPPTEPVQRVTVDMPGHFEYEILGFEAKPGSLIVGRDLAQLALPDGIQVMALIRDGVPQNLRPGLLFAPGDYLYFLARPRSIPHLSKLFDPHRVPDRLEEHRYFGDFVLHGDAVLGDVAAVYGLAVPDATSGQSLADYLGEAFHGRAVVGDRVRLGSAELVVREIENGRISRVGLRLR